VRLDGSVPQKKAAAIGQPLPANPRCQLFLTTNAGSTGLNLQAANTVINVDLPWNPAVLEQRIARAHRMGQKRPVQVFVLITEDTIEDGCWPRCRPSTNWRWPLWIPIRTSTRSSWPRAWTN
jgi:SNF2 family DNA or RNA helicase